MSFYSNSNVDTHAAVGVDMGAIMRQVYLWMTLGLAVTAGVSFYVASSGLGIAFFENPLLTIITIVAYLILAIALQPIVMRGPLALGIGVYLLVTILLGVMLSSIFYAGADYVTTANRVGRVSFDPNTLQTIGFAFVATSATFGVMSVIGYTTRVDLSRYGSLLFMALIGLVIASFVNMLFYSSALYWIINYAGVLIFTALTAYDTQRIKNLASGVAMSSSARNGEITVADTSVQRVAIVGAFILYLDFINLFLFIFRILMGGRRR